MVTEGCRQLLRRPDVVAVWLTVMASTAQARLAASGQDRPLLDDPAAYDRLWHERRRHYLSVADVVVATDAVPGPRRTRHRSAPDTRRGRGGIVSDVRNIGVAVPGHEYEVAIGAGVTGRIGAAAAATGRGVWRSSPIRSSRSVSRQPSRPSQARVST